MINANRLVIFMQICSLKNEEQMEKVEMGF